MRFHCELQGGRFVAMFFPHDNWPIISKACDTAGEAKAWINDVINDQIATHQNAIRTLHAINGDKLVDAIKF